MSYVDGLQTIIDRFYNPLRFHLRSADFATIFINIYEILSLHRSFLPELTQAVLKSLGLIKNEMQHNIWICVQAIYTSINFE